MLKDIKIKDITISDTYPLFPSLNANAVSLDVSEYTAQELLFLVRCALKSGQVVVLS